MRRAKTVLILFTLVLLFLGCQSLLMDTGEFIGLDFDFQFAKTAPAHSIFYPGQSNTLQPQPLSKTNRLVKDTVLLLHFEEDSGNVARDATTYGNNALLFNVERVPTQSGRGIFLDGSRSYAFVPNSAELDGVLGLNISFSFYPTGTSETFTQVLVSKRDQHAGYAIGLDRSRLYFGVMVNDSTVQVESTTLIEPERWYQVKAGFDRGEMSLILNGTREASTSFTGPLAHTDKALVIGAALADLATFTYFFRGYMDELEIETVTDYLDIDFIRVVVMDFSRFRNMDEFYLSPIYHDYEQEFWKVQEKVREMTWTDYLRIWSDYFTIVTDQTLAIKGGYAEGLVNGVEGLNKIVVSAIKDGKIIYYGEGHSLAGKNKSTKAHITMWPVAGEPPE